MHVDAVAHVDLEGRDGHPRQNDAHPTAEAGVDVLELGTHRGRSNAGRRDAGAAGVALEQGRCIDEDRCGDVEGHMRPGDPQMQEHRLILGLHAAQGVAVELVGEIAAQVGPANPEQLCHGTPPVRGRVVDDPAEDDGRVVPPEAAIQLHQGLELGIVEVGAPVAVGQLILDAHANAMPESLPGAGVVVLDLELHEEDPAAARIVGQCNRSRCQILDGTHSQAAGRQSKRSAGVGGKHPADLATAAHHGGRHLHEHSVVHKEADLLWPVEPVQCVGKRGAGDKRVAVLEEGVAPGLADLTRGEQVYIATENVLVGIGEAAGPIAAAEAGRGKGEPSQLADSLHHNLDRVGFVVQVHTPYCLLGGQLDENPHAAEQIALEQALLGGFEHSKIHRVPRVQVHARRQHPRCDPGCAADRDVVDDQPGRSWCGPGNPTSNHQSSTDQSRGVHELS